MWKPCETSGESPVGRAMQHVYSRLATNVEVYQSEIKTKTDQNISEQLPSSKNVLVSTRISENEFSFSASLRDLRPLQET